ncbi:hypothetical protein CDL12_18511 [Handroanthus impetiginosus]|uniref:BHLH domain-containing protein n=1 Tax=Handroanthus impetiginosus TaxID=429701 RepID=A0A2G9GUI9_9LAMI|nr:hypothetical protein CDL12_18511 [Handroanthus impetiginosus]
MDRLKTDEDSLESRQINDVEVNDAVTSRKVLKADREKLRRDKLNEQFQELGNLLDPGRPKNDKASVLTDTIQVLKDLNSEVTKLKAEHAVLCEESCELTQEKNELRQEKVSLKSDINGLKAQHHQSQRFMVPWMAQPYPFPVGLPVHQMIQPLPFLANHHTATPNPNSTFIPYLAPIIHRLDQPNTLNASSSYISGPENSTERSSHNKRVDNSNEVATDLELKAPGATAIKELPPRERGKQIAGQQQETKSVKNESCSSKSSSQVSQSRASNNIDDV